MAIPIERQSRRFPHFRASSTSVIFSCVFLCAFLLSPSFVSGAFISGKIYDLSYNEIQQIVMKVDSTPPQTYVASTGYYSFFLPPGTYLLSAHDGASEDELQAENITISDDGNYTIDIIIYSDVITPEEQEQLSDTMDISSSLSDTSVFGNGGLSWLLGAIMVAILAGIALILFLMPKRDGQSKNRRNEKNKMAEASDISISELPKKVLDILDAHEGRMTQKEIRKLLPYSEAKISLVISELEHGGKLKRIKKGRGNIIVKS